MIPLRDINPTRTRPWLTWALMALNVGVFLLQATSSARGRELLVGGWGFVPGRFFADPLGDWPTVFSSMFLHGGLMHLASNMLFLWVFGDNVEDRLGKGRFLMFYLLSGVGAALGQALVDPFSTIPMVGASGAIAGVLGAYFLLFPGARVRTIIPPLFFWPFDLPAWLVIAGWFLIQVVDGFASLAGSSQVGVAFFAHIGGFLTGLWLTRRMLPPPPARPVIRVVFR